MTTITLQPLPKRHESPRRGTCPNCHAKLTLVFADDKKRVKLVFPQHHLMPQTTAEAHVRNLPICTGSGKSPDNG